MFAPFLALLVGAATVSAGSVPAARLLAVPAAVPAEAPAPAPAAEAAPQADVRKLDADACAAIAVGGSGLVREADAKVDEWKGRLAEVESVFYPKLFGLGFVAPMFRVTGAPSDLDVKRDYGSWGPYVHLQATLAQPLYTFGRAAAGEDAARERIEVERARARQVRNTIALETRKLYYLHLYARSMRPALENARKTLDQALGQAQTAYDEGKISKVDISRLEYASAELDKFRVQARIGEDLALAALKHTMGLPQEAQLVLADERLPDAPAAPPPDLARLYQVAAEERPEWAQIKHGKKAALSLEQAERLANAPVVFAAGQLNADYTPMRPNVKNPYYYDPYNGVSAGVALGLKFDLDPAKAAAKGDQAKAMGEQVDALQAFASTGIPLEVRKARDDLQQATEILASSSAGAVAARKWMIFAGAAYNAGTGEAKDLLEGLAAWLQAKRSEYESLRDVHTARAYLLYATGRAQPDAPVAVPANG